MPRCAVTQHGVEDHQEFAHGGGQCQLGRFAAGPEALVEGADHRVVPAGDQRRHVERAAHHPAAALDAALAAALAGIPRDRREPGQSGDRFAVAAAELGQQRQQRARRDRPDAGHRRQDGGPLRAVRLRRERRRDLLVERRELGLQPGQMPHQRVPDRGLCRAPQAVALAVDRLGQLASAQHQGLQAGLRHAQAAGAPPAGPARRSARSSRHRGDRFWPATRDPWQTAECGAD